MRIFRGKIGSCHAMLIKERTPRLPSQIYGQAYSPPAARDINALNSTGLMLASPACRALSRGSRSTKYRASDACSIHWPSASQRAHWPRCPAVIRRSPQLGGLASKSTSRSGNRISKRACPCATTPGQRCGETDTEDRGVMSALWVRWRKGKDANMMQQLQTSKGHAKIFIHSYSGHPCQDFPLLTFRKANDAKKQVEIFAKHDVLPAMLSPNGYDSCCRWILRRRHWHVGRKKCKQCIRKATFSIGMTNLSVDYRKS